MCILLADFVVLLMSEFHVIFCLGLDDWTRVLIDCQKKKVQL